MKFYLLNLFAIASFILSAQSVLVKDINPSSDSKEDTGGAHLVINGIAYFIADDGTSGIELWRSDGTESGTFLVKDINPGSESSEPIAFHNVNGELFFYANNGTSGLELWKTDGTESGTVQIKDIAPGAAGSYLNEGWTHFHETAFTVMDNKLYFAADDGIGGRELWVSDGTESGTQQIFEFETGTGIDSPLEFFIVFNNKIYFRANKRLWVSDGTTDGTEIFTTKVSDPTELIVAERGFYFEGSGAGAGHELWFSDGTEEGTHLVKDIYVASINNDGAFLSSINQNYAVIGNKIFFIGNDRDPGFELWVSDGTELGTKKLTNIPSGSSGGGFKNFSVLEDKLIFSWNGGSTFDFEPWISDGTVTGTKKIKDIDEGAFGSITTPFERVIFRNKLFFHVADGFDDYIWETDGTEENTLYVTEHLDGDEFKPGDFMALNDSTLLFFGRHDELGRELLKFTEPGVLDALIDVEKGISCAGDADGVLGANPMGGYAPYKYEWSDGSVRSSLENLAEGQYSLTVTDARDSEVAITFDFSEPEPITYSDPVIINETNGMSNGSIEVTGVTGGTSPYTISWSTGDTTFMLSDLSFGNYFFTITDVNDCEVESKVIQIQNTSSTHNPILNQIRINPTLVTDGMINIDNVLVSIPYDVELISGTGQLITTEKGLAGNRQIELNQTPGVYIIRLSFGDDILTKRILISR